MPPRYFSLNSSSGTKSFSNGAAYWAAVITYSVFGVTKAPPCCDLYTGLVTICTVSKSCRLITATRGLALSLMNRYWPS